MTVSAFSTASTIEPPLRPDPADRLETENGAARTSAADLKFLHRPQQARSGTSDR
jgi:hypothetical protein